MIRRQHFHSVFWKSDNIYRNGSPTGSGIVLKKSSGMLIASNTKKNEKKLRPLDKTNEYPDLKIPKEPLPHFYV
jgi:hypothetical protein